jgi:hypothetical protein
MKILVLGAGGTGGYLRQAASGPRTPQRNHRTLLEKARAHGVVG